MFSKGISKVSQQSKIIIIVHANVPRVNEKKQTLLQEEWEHISLFYLKRLNGIDFYLNLEHYLSYIDELKYRTRSEMVCVFKLM